MKAVFTISTLKNISGIFFIFAIFLTSALSTSAMSKNSEVVTKEVIKVRLGEVLKVNSSTSTFSLILASSTIRVDYNDETRVQAGNESPLSLSEAIRKGAKVYVFGILSSDGESMIAEKIIVKNESKLSRKNLSLTTPENTTSVADLLPEEGETEAFSLWVKLWKGVVFTTAYSAERLEESLTYLQVSSSSSKIIQERPQKEEVKESATFEASSKHKIII